MSQAPYPPPEVPSADDLAETAKATTEDIHYANSLLIFIDLQKQGVLGMLPAEVLHPGALLQSYIEEGIRVIIGPPWSREDMENAINNGPHASAYTPEMVGFIRGGGGQRRVKY